MTNARLFAEWVVLLLAACALVVLAYMGGWTDRFDLSVLDLANEVSLSEADDRIVLVEIDDRSLQNEGVWPWDRTQHARIIQTADAADARVIVLDILFLEPTTEQSDSALATAMRETGKVFIPFTLTSKPNAIEGTIPVYPIEEFRQVAAGSGHVAVFPESDGAIRNFDVILANPDGNFPHLAKSVTDYFTGSSQIVSSEPTYIPLYPRGSYRTISASDLLQGNVPDTFLADKIVVVGATAQGLGDRYAVPAYAGRIMSGVELQANLIDALINDQLIEAMSSVISLTILLGFVFCLFMAFWHLAPRQVLIFVFVLVVVLILVAFASVILFDRWLPVGPALLAIVLAYPFWGWRRLSSVSRQLEREAGRLLDDPALKSEGAAEGFDAVARHLAMLKSLTGKIRADWMFLRGIVNASPDPMLVFDGTGRAVLMNNPAESLFSHTDQKKRPTFEEIVADAGAHIEKDDEGETVIFENGKAFLLARSTLDSGVASEILDLRDVTDLRETERQRQQMLEFLSHDMRSPQVAIIGLTGSALEGKGTRERFSRIEAEARRTLKLADDFVQIARLEYTGLEREDSDVGAILYEAVDRAYPLAKASSVIIKTDIPDEPVFAIVDPAALARAMDNLIGNALKFSDSGKSVLVKLKESGSDSVEIMVADEGPGLPQERLDNPFARYGTRDERAGPSAGLGLAFVAMVVRDHGGKIDVDSRPDKGTSFTLCLPRN